MTKPIILFTLTESAGELEALQKAHVSSYTRKDGTFVAEHDDKRVAKTKAGGKKPAALGVKAQKSIGAIAKHHLGFDTLETRNSDSHDFKETSRWGWKSALHAAHAHGYMHATGSVGTKHEDSTHGSHDEIEGIAKKHGPFSDLKTRNSGEDFSDTSVWSARDALEEAYRMGHARGKEKAAAAKPKAGG